MPWTIGEVIESTFRAFGRNWVALAIGTLIAGLLAGAPTLLWAGVTIPALLIKASAPGFQPGDVATTAFFVTLALALFSSIVLWILFAPALTRMALSAARGGRPRLGEVFDFSRAGTYLGAGFLSGLAVFAGSLLLVVPGIIVAMALSFVTFFVVDGAANRGAVASIEASWAATRGHRLHLFGLALLAGLFNAVLQFVVGLTVLLAPLQLALPVVTTPLWTLALAVIYLRITKQHDDAAATLAA